MKTEITLESLVGEHELSGVDFEVIKSANRWDDDANCIRFVLDGVTYVATEAPEDGYRSCMGTLVRDTEPDEPVKNTFSPVNVGIWMAPNVGQDNDYIQVFDLQNKELILEVGTANTDDYYPWFVGDFYPEKMSLNKDVKA